MFLTEKNKKLKGNLRSGFISNIYSHSNTDKKLKWNFS